MRSGCPRWRMEQLIYKPYESVVQKPSVAEWKRIHQLLHGERFEEGFEVVGKGGAWSEMVAQGGAWNNKFTNPMNQAVPVLPAKARA